MDLADFDYDLPADRIAQAPVDVRDDARMLVDRGPSESPADLVVRALPSVLAAGDLLVVNHTRVLPARLHLRKVSGGAAEVLLLEPGPVPGEWDALVRPSRRLPPGTELLGAGPDPVVEVGADLGEGRRRVRLLPGAEVARLGELPLPPYITEPLADPERYQTVYSHAARSAAAPTAGLHLTTALLDRIRGMGVRIAEVELVVGLGTFRPITAANIDDHVMHAERYRVPTEVMAACADARRVVAVGTTTLRALESAAKTGELEGRTELFVRRPFDFQVVDLLLTNFHLPCSSLLVLIDAFVGPRWRALYEHALATGYRFLSFGDAMLLDRSLVGGVGR